MMAPKLLSTQNHRLLLPCPSSLSLYLWPVGRPPSPRRYLSGPESLPHLTTHLRSSRTLSLSCFPLHLLPATGAKKTCSWHPNARPSLFLVLCLCLHTFSTPASDSQVDHLCWLLPFSGGRGKGRKPHTYSGRSRVPCHAHVSTPACRGGPQSCCHPRLHPRMIKDNKHAVGPDVTVQQTQMAARAPRHGSS